MKWIKRIAIALAVLMLFAGALALWATQQAETTQHPVAIEVAHVGRGAAGEMPVVIWYPTTAKPAPTTLLGLTLLNVAVNGPIAGRSLPLIVISHGNGGGPGSHADLAMALADAGYIVAAPMHPGDNINDQSGIARPGVWKERNRDVSATIDFLLNAWRRKAHLDPAKIGAFGFSAGGFTVLTAIGGQPDLASIPQHCATRKEFVCAVLGEAKSPLLKSGGAIADSEFATDARIAAASIAAPGLGFTFANPERLAAVRVPVQLWIGAEDDRTPEASNADLIRKNLPAPPEYHRIGNAGHMSFLTPCRLIALLPVCHDAPGFDRATFHRDMNAAVLNFFNRTLKQEN